MFTQITFYYFPNLSSIRQCSSLAPCNSYSSQAPSHNARATWVAQASHHGRFSWRHTKPTRLQSRHEHMCTFDRKHLAPQLLTGYMHANSMLKCLAANSQCKFTEHSTSSAYSVPVYYSTNPIVTLLNRDEAIVLYVQVSDSFQMFTGLLLIRHAPLKSAQHQCNPPTEKKSPKKVNQYNADSVQTSTSLSIIERRHTMSSKLP